MSFARGAAATVLGLLGLTAVADAGGPLELAMIGTRARNGAPALPDLAIRDLEVSLHPDGRFVVLRYRLTNAGRGHAPASLATWSLSYLDARIEGEAPAPVPIPVRATPAFAPGTAEIDGLVHDPLPPGTGEDRRHTLYWPIPSRARGRRVLLTVEADGTGEVLEQGEPERDNRVSAQVTIPGERSAVDPTIHDLRVVRRKGRVLRLRAEIVNAGRGRTGPLTYTWSANSRTHGPLEERRLTGLVTGVTESIEIDHGISAEDVSRGVIEFTFELDAPDDRDFSNNVFVLRVPVVR